ncbi:transcriptional corepressor LEUNIG_HOMOLOG-like [Cornus florida]|uniref:transcriptional corepressor LEUNIG_HOMOLOG-like n=1 Tax=Cornus florida TaxID=4283 RepID=UPI00289794C1|nr:transcriptional corepressor LEUNIG_HOMOLOG-like [Cornus florida]
MSSPAGWNSRVMFERYVFDYLRKRDMQETAEIFRREADPTIDPNTPPAIDVPDGFLHEWWLIFYDMFKARQQNNPEHNGGPSYTGEQMMIMAQQGLNPMPSTGGPLMIGRRVNSAYSEDKSNVVPIAADCPSETSSSIPKSLDDIVKPSSSHSNDNKDEGRRSSNNSLTHNATSSTNASKDTIVLEGTFVKYKFHNFKLLISALVGVQVFIPCQVA